MEGGGEIGLWVKFFKCDFAAKNASGSMQGVPNFVFFDNRPSKNWKWVGKKLIVNLENLTSFSFHGKSIN